MPYNRLADGVRLVLRRAVREEELPRDDGALELEAHLRRREEGVGGADVVQEAREVVRLGVVRPGREVRADESGACAS